MHMPDIGRVLPVYVADEYEGFDAKPFPELTDAELEHYIDANVEAVRAVPTPDVALANHLVMGPVILARALGGAAPYAVKIHGSALEYTVRPHPRALPPVRARGDPRRQRRARGLAPHRRVALRGAGRRAVAARAHPPGAARRGRAHLPPPRARPEADRGSRPAAGWGGEQGTADVLRTLDLSRDRIVSYVGKLIVSKGVDLLFAAWPLVVDRVPDARLLVVGFGTYRDALDALRGRAAPRRRRGPEGDRRARARARGRAGRRAALPERVPRHASDEDWLRAAPGGRRAHPLHGPARARRPALPAARVRGAGDAVHLPGVVRHGRRGGGRLRRAAAVGEPLGDGGGHGHARARAARASCGR